MALFTKYWGLDGLFILLFILSIGIYLYLTRNFNYWKKRGVKQVNPTILFGNLKACLLAQRPLLHIFDDIYNSHEDEAYVGFYIIDKPYLLIRDPEIVRHVLIKDFNNFADKNTSSHKHDSVGQNSIFSAKNPEWKYIRQKLSPIFTSARLRKMFELMLEIDKDFDVYLDSLKLEGEGRPLEVKEICTLFTTDLIGITAYGLRLNALKDPDGLLRKVGKGIFDNNYKRHIELLSGLLIPSLVKIFKLYLFGKEASKFLQDIFLMAMNERMSSGVKKDDLIDLLIDLKNEQEKDDSYKLKDDEITAQAAVFFTGGFETSSSTMSFVLYELAKNPDIQKKLREEILNALNENDGKVTYEMITSSVPYLNMVVAETLRIYPSLPFFDRKAHNDYQVPGTKLTLKAGTPVVIPMRSFHMDPKYFPNPNFFDPERFSATNKKDIKPNTYFPFGDGPRMCIGKRLGYLQIKLGIIHLISKYEFSPCQETLIPMEFSNLNIITVPKKEIVLNMKKISVDHLRLTEVGSPYR